jgi:Tir chaperone protein (CesT) family
MGRILQKRSSKESHVSDAHATMKPIYADRASGRIYPDARTMVNAYLARFGEHAGLAIEPLDAGGYTQLRRGSANVGVNVLEEHGVLLLVAPVMTVPFTGREALFRRLLELSFLTTSDAAFALDAHRNEVVVRALRRLSGLDYEELEDLLDTVGRVTDDWDEKLRAEFAQ